jgi:hypothetical protein
MMTRSEVLAKFFLILRDYYHEIGLASSSPEVRLETLKHKSIIYELEVSASEIYALYGELSDAFSIDVGDFYEFVSPTVGELVDFIIGKSEQATMATTKEVDSRKYGVIGIGMENALLTRDTLTSDWQQVPNSGSVLGITIMPDGKLLGIGMDNALWTRDTLTSDWQQVPNSGSVLGITVMPDGKLLGIGMENALWTRDTLTSDWQQLPNSGSVLAVTPFCKSLH